MFWLVFLKMGVWYIKIIEIDPFQTEYRKYAHKMCTKVHKVLKSCPQLPKLCTRHYVTKIIGFHTSKRIWDPLPPSICYFLRGTKAGIFKWVDQRYAVYQSLLLSFRTSDSQWCLYRVSMRSSKKSKRTFRTPVLNLHVHFHI